jgi:hypothetical protein
VLARKGERRRAVWERDRRSGLETGSAVDRSRRSSSRVTPGRTRTASTLCIGQTGVSVQPVRRSRAERTAFRRTERLWSERVRPAMSDECVGQDGRLRPACGPGTTRSGLGVVARLRGRRRDHPHPHPSGTNTPHQSSKPAASRSPGAAFEPGSFGGPRRPDGGGRGTAGMARLPDVDRAAGENPPPRAPTSPEVVRKNNPLRCLGSPASDCKSVSADAVQVYQEMPATAAARGVLRQLRRGVCVRREPRENTLLSLLRVIQ